MKRDIAFRCLNDTSLKTAALYTENIQRTECNMSTSTHSFKQHVNTTRLSFLYAVVFQISDMLPLLYSNKNKSTLTYS